MYGTETMTRPVPTCLPDATLDEVVRKMWDTQAATVMQGQHLHCRSQLDTVEDCLHMSEKPPTLAFGSRGACTTPDGKNNPPRDVLTEARITIKAVEDIVEARQKGRALAQELGFSMRRSTLVATAISELARNIVLYAKTGEIVLSRVSAEQHIGLIISAADKGPGIANIQHALISGYCSSGGLGLGLPGVRQMVDEFDIKSRPGDGTQITALMWL